ncbi:MAG TPA: nucleotidyltransferase [Pirellulales bacterium]|nr:nucleotidyltransferase [Pirellulales bacterium]
MPIAHADADCFYVSAERVRYPHLHKLPVGVLSNQGACVIARSYELKRKGITVGMPIWEARPLCPHAVFVKRDFEWYECLSRRMLDVLHTVSPTVEYYSIDEMFFDASGVDPRPLQQQILRDVGIPVTIGISKTRSLAKLASDNAKPFGCWTATSNEQIAELLIDRSVDEITGIARRSARKLEAYGIKTCADFAHADRRLIRRLLTKTGESLWWELNGNPVTEISTTRLPHKVLSRGGSVGKATADPGLCESWIVRNVERLIEALDFHLVFCEQIALAVEFKDASAAALRASLPSATADYGQIVTATLQMWEQMGRGKTLAYMHVLAERLSSRRCFQRGLFDQPTEQQQRLADAKRLINQRVGRFTLRSAATLPLTQLYGDPANNYEVCDIAGKTCF